MISIGRLTKVAILTVFTAGLAGCMHAEDPVWQYAKRSDKITFSGGNAVASNEAIQMVDPWPRASANRRIPANGERMAVAHERYRNVDKQPLRQIMLYPPDVQRATGSAATAAK